MQESIDPSARNPADDGGAFDLSKFLQTLALLAGAIVIVGSFCLIVIHRHRAQELVVHVGYLPIYVDLPVFVAYQRGLFAQHHVHIQLDKYNSSPDLGAALASKAIVAAASIAYASTLMSEIQNPGNLKIFMVDAENKENYLSSVVTLPDSGIDSIEALTHKKLGSFPGPEAVTFLRIILRKHGLDPDKDVVIDELQAGSHISALQSHAVDALFTYEPIATQAVQEIGAIKLAPGVVEREVISPWQAGVWVLGSEFIEHHPSEAQGLIGAIYEAVELIRKNPTVAKSALNDWTEISSRIAEATPTIPFTRIGEIDLTALQQHADLLAESHIVSRHVGVQSLLISPTIVLRSVR